MRIERFEDLDIWKKSIELYVDIFRTIENSSLKNDFSAKDQLKRATLSISNNIAEGFEYESNLQFIRFLRYSKGSAGEIRNMVTVFFMTEQISKEQHDKLIEKTIEISKSIKGFMKYLNNTRKQ
jgi:four helix bundle protein